MVILSNQSVKERKKVPSYLKNRKDNNGRMTVLIMLKPEYRKRETNEYYNVGL